jgi:hypothetical protein
MKALTSVVTGYWLQGIGLDFLRISVFNIFYCFIVISSSTLTGLDAEEECLTVDIVNVTRS